jgi:hypothetical protein
VGSSSGSTIFADDGDGRSRSHCEGWDLDLMRLIESVEVWKGRCSSLTLFVVRRRNW